MRRLGGSGLLCNEPVHEKHDDCADDGTDPSRAFSRFVHAQCSAQVPCDHRSDDAQHDGHDDAHLLITRHDRASEQAYDEADDNHAYDAMTAPPPGNDAIHDIGSSLHEAWRFTMTCVCL